MTLPLVTRCAPHELPPTPSSRAAHASDLAPSFQPNQSSFLGLTQGQWEEDAIIFLWNCQTRACGHVLCLVATTWLKWGEQASPQSKVQTGGDESRSHVAPPIFVPEALDPHSPSFVSVGYPPVSP